VPIIFIFFCYNVPFPFEFLIRLQLVFFILIITLRSKVIDHIDTGEVRVIDLLVIDLLISTLLTNLITILSGFRRLIMLLLLGSFIYLVLFLVDLLFIQHQFILDLVLETKLLNSDRFLDYFGLILIVVLILTFIVFFEHFKKKHECIYIIKLTSNYDSNNPYNNSYHQYIQCILYMIVDINII